MKKILIIFMLLCNITIFSQVKNEYSNTYENDTCKKEYLFSKSKMYIVDVFKSANNVIQNEDLSYGAIVCKGNVESGGYRFSFTLKIKVKDGICKIVVDEIYNSSTPVSSSGQKYGTLSLDGYEGMWKNNMTKKRYIAIMEDVNRKLNNLVDNYDDFIIAEEEF